VYRRIRRAAACLGAALLAAGCLGPVADLYPPRPGEPAVTVWVVDHGWHTGLVVRRADVDRRLWPEVDDVPAAAFLEVGWGDRDFYMAEPGTAWMALRAAFGGTPTVLHVAALAVPPAAAVPGREVVALRLSRRGFDALSNFVGDTYQRDVAGRATALQPGHHGASRFYAARGTYSLFNTCNTWAARALRAAGAPVTPAWAATAGGLMRQARAAAAP
jgi:uncharacterized protein (TIGR02117 family)